MSRQDFVWGTKVGTQFIRLGNSVSLPWLKFGLFASLTVASIAVAATASARSRSRGDYEKKAKVEEQAPPTGPMFFVISVGKQHVSAYGNNGLFARAPVSTGRAGHSTPTGIFSILEKTATIGPTSTAARPCLTCSVLRGLALRYTRAFYPDTRPPMAA